MRFPSILLFISLYRSPTKTLSYSSAKKWLKENDNNEIIYGNNTSKVNCEHIVPQSYIKRYKIDKKSLTDLHILYLSNPRINSHRQNYKFNDLNNFFIPLDDNGKLSKNIIYSKKI